MKSIFSLVILAVAIFFGTASFSVNELDAASATAVMRISLKENCKICESCGGSGSSNHISSDASAGDRVGNAHPDTCAPGSCDAMHPKQNCGGETFDFAASWNATINSEFDQLRSDLANSPQRVAINGEKKTIQWFNCDGEVIASIPITARDIRSLTE